MRKFLPAVFASLILVFSTSIVAFGTPGQSPSKICDANDNYGTSHDACVVCVAQGNLYQEFLTPTCACKLLEDNYYDGATLQDFGFDNLGECISSGFTGP